MSQYDLKQISEIKTNIYFVTSANLLKSKFIILVYFLSAKAFRIGCYFLNLQVSATNL